MSEVENLKGGHYYLNTKNGQAIGMVTRQSTASWGECWIVEVATPGQLGQMMVMRPDAEKRDGWVEIPRPEFIEYQKKYVGQFHECMKQIQEEKKSWIQKAREKILPSKK